MAGSGKCGNMPGRFVPVLAVSRTRPGEQAPYNLLWLQKEWLHSHPAYFGTMIWKTVNLVSMSVSL